MSSLLNRSRFPEAWALDILVSLVPRIALDTWSLLRNVRHIFIIYYTWYMSYVITISYIIMYYI